MLDHIDIPALDQTENLFSTRQLSHESEDSSGDISPNLTIDEEILPLRPLLPSQIPLPGSGRNQNTFQPFIKVLKKIKISSLKPTRLTSLLKVKLKQHFLIILIYICGPSRTLKNND